MNTSYALPFSRRSILRVAAILVIGYALTAIAISLWAQAPSPAADGWVPVSNISRAGSHGFAASDGQMASAAGSTRSSAQFIPIAFRTERDPRAAVAATFLPQPSMPGARRDAKPQFVTGLSARGFYSHQ